MVRRRTIAALGGVLALALLAALLSRPGGCSPVRLPGAATPRPDGAAVIGGGPRAGLPEPPAPGARSPDGASHRAAWRAAAEALLEGTRDALWGADDYAVVVESEEARAALAGMLAADRDEVRRLLLGSERDRAIGLAALAASAVADEELLGLAVRMQRPEDEPAVRLLGAEVIASIPPEAMERLQDDVVRALSAEPNPLVLVVALPGLERLDQPRLVALLEAQLRLAGPEMRPILLGLARARVGEAALVELRAALAREGGAPL